MNNVFIKFVSLSFSGSIIAFILFAIISFFKFKISKVWQYYIWIIVILRLIIPFSPKSNLISYLYNLFDSNFTTDILLNNKNIFLLNIQKYLWVGWLFIAFILLLKKIISYNIYIYFIKLNRKIITDKNIIQIYYTICNQMGIKRKPCLYSYKRINSPMLVGFFKPYILLPEELLTTADNLQYILLHELTHYRRLDFIYKWFTQLIACIHFFNPFIFIITNMINTYCELSCDEIVIRNLDEHNRKKYGSVLIDSLELNIKHNQHPIPFKFYNDIKQIKERLEAIIRYKKSSNFIIIFTIILTIIICSSAIYVGSYKSNSYYCCYKAIMYYIK